MKNHTKKIAPGGTEGHFSDGHQVIEKTTQSRGKTVSFASDFETTKKFRNHWPPDTGPREHLTFDLEIGNRPQRGCRD